MTAPDPAADLLLLIDIQNDFCPGGALAVADGDAVVPVANALVDRFSHVALTQDWHPAGHFSFASSHPGVAAFFSIGTDHGPQTLWPDHCVQGTEGAAFHAGLNTDRAELVVRKGFRPGTIRQGRSTAIPPSSRMTAARRPALPDGAGTGDSATS